MGSYKREAENQLWWPAQNLSCNIWYCQFYCYLINMRRARCSRILALLLITLLCMPNTVTSGSSSDSNSDDEKSMEEDLEVEKVKETKNTNVVILTTANFGSHVGGGTVWLVEFYAPWWVFLILSLACGHNLCRNQKRKEFSLNDNHRIFHFSLSNIMTSHRCTHCMNFASTYSEVARHFHSDPNSNVRVGKVDTTVEKALGQRFSVHAFPSFFVIRGSSAFEFDGHRSKNNLINFVEKGYKEHPVSEDLLQRWIQPPREACLTLEFDILWNC